MLLLYGRSARWAGPLVIWLLFMILVFGSGIGSISDAVVFIWFFLPAGVWIAMVMGDLDDDPGRDLLVAAAGSAARLHVYQALASVVVVASVAAVTVVIGLGYSPGGVGDLPLSMGMWALLVGVALVGVGSGTWLHRPILRHRGAQVLLAIASVVFALYLKPVQDLIRSVSTGESRSGAVMAVASGLWLSISTLFAGQLARRRN